MRFGVTGPQCHPVHARAWNSWPILPCPDVSHPIHTDFLGHLERNDQVLIKTAAEFAIADLDVPSKLKGKTISKIK